MIDHAQQLFPCEKVDAIAMKISRQDRRRAICAGESSQERDLFPHNSVLT